MFDDMIMNYSVRYQLTSGTGGSATVYSSSASVTLQGLDPNAEYNVSVAGINSCGGTSTFAITQFKFQGTVTPVYSLVVCVTYECTIPLHQCQLLRECRGCEQTVIRMGETVCAFKQVSDNKVTVYGQSVSAASTGITFSSASPFSCDNTEVHFSEELMVMPTDG